jgi:hypothetical protein
MLAREQQATVEFTRARDSMWMPAVAGQAGRAGRAAAKGVLVKTRQDTMRGRARPLVRRVSREAVPGKRTWRKEGKGALVEMREEWTSRRA